MLKLLGTSEKAQIMEQFELLHRILGPRNIHMKNIRKQLKVPYIKVSPNPNYIWMSTFALSFMQANQAAHILVTHIKKIEKELEQFILEHDLPQQGLRFQTKKFIRSLDADDDEPNHLSRGD